MKKNRHFFKKENGVTLVELLIAAFAGLICLAVISVVYIGGIRAYELNEERAEAINRLWLNMNKIQREIRSGRQFITPTSYETTYGVGITASEKPPLAFKLDDVKAVAFYTPEGSSDLYRASCDTVEIFAPSITISAAIGPASRFATIVLTTSWSYRDITREENVSSQVSLRNWRTQW